MGVADMASRSAPGPFARSAARCPTPKRCCSSMTTSERHLNVSFSERSAVVPKSTQAAPEAHAEQASSRSMPRVAPVTSRHEMPAASRTGPSFSAYWRARTEVGAIIAACVPVSAQAARASAATAVLPVPTSPKSKRFMTRGAAMSARIWSAAARCSPESSKGNAERRASMRGPTTSCS